MVRSVIDMVGKNIKSYASLDPLLQIKWMESTTQFEKKKGDLLYVPQDVGKLNCYIILEGIVSIFTLHPQTNQVVFLQTYHAGEILNERSALTPYPTDHGAIVVSDHATFLSFPPSAVNDNDDYKNMALEIGRNMMLKLSHTDLIKSQLLRKQPNALADHQNKFINRHRIDMPQLLKGIDAANKLKKVAKFDLMCQKPTQNAGEKKTQYDALATTQFKNKKGVQIDAAKIKSSLYLKNIVSLI
jgi:CRP-like cAMP-binding protein